MTNGDALRDRCHRATRQGDHRRRLQQWQIDMISCEARNRLGTKDLKGRNQRGSRLYARPSSAGRHWRPAASTRRTSRWSMCPPRKRRRRSPGLTWTQFAAWQPEPPDRRSRRFPARRQSARARTFRADRTTSPARQPVWSLSARRTTGKKSPKSGNKNRPLPLESSHQGGLPSSGMWARVQPASRGIRCLRRREQTSDA